MSQPSPIVRLGWVVLGLLGGFCKPTEDHLAALVAICTRQYQTTIALTCALGASPDLPSYTMVILAWKWLGEKFQASLCVGISKKEQGLQFFFCFIGISFQSSLTRVKMWPKKMNRDINKRWAKQEEWWQPRRWVLTGTGWVQMILGKIKKKKKKQQQFN